MAESWIWWPFPAPARKRPGTMHMIAQHDDGGREVVYDRYRSLCEAADDARQEFARGFVCCVVYDGEKVTTILPDGVLSGEHWQRPLLPPNAVICEGPWGRRIKYRAA